MDSQASVPAFPAASSRQGQFGTRAGPASGLRAGGLRILSVLPYPPSRIRSRSLHLLRTCCRLGEVELLYLDDGGPIELPAGLAAVHRLPNASRGRRLLRLGRALVQGEAALYAYYGSSRLRRRLRCLDPSRFDLVLAERLPLRRSWLGGTPLVLDLLDCATAKSRAMAGLERGARAILYRRDARLLPQREAEICAQADLVLVTAEREARAVRDLGVSTPVEVFPHLSWFRCADSPPPPGESLVFHGKLSYAPNRAALAFLHDVLLPRLDPPREIRILGPAPSSLRRRFPRLVFEGFVEDLRGRLALHGLSVHPLPVSVGVSGKALDSLAAGVPVLTTPAVAAGLPELSRRCGDALQAVPLEAFPERVQAWFERPPEERRVLAARGLEAARSLLESERREAPARLAGLLRRYLHRSSP